MDLLQKEHERVWKRMKAAKSISDVQATIDLLQEARDSIAAGNIYMRGM
jgi:E3 ubiquitin-protein transferase RMND5